MSTDDPSGPATKAMMSGSRHAGQVFIAHGHDQIAGLHAGFKGGTVVEWGSDQCTSGIRRNGNADSRERALHFLDEFVTVPGGIQTVYGSPAASTIPWIAPSRSSSRVSSRTNSDSRVWATSTKPCDNSARWALLASAAGSRNTMIAAGKKHQNGGPTGSQSEVLPRG